MTDEPMNTPKVAIPIFGDRLPLAEAYWKSLADDATVRGLIGPREVPRLWDRHILNCAVIQELIEADATVFDIGSGAGLPGIPLAIARPDLRITLIEPLLRRSSYLEEIIKELRLSNVTVLRGRAEEGPVRKQAGTADIVTSRAVAPLGKLSRWSLPLVKKGGAMLALKGSSAEEEIERDGAIISKIGGGKCTIEYAGGEVLDPPTLVVRCPRRK